MVEQENQSLDTEKEPVEAEDEHIDAGDGIFSWEAWEFLPHERSKLWYVVAAIVSVLLIVYAVWTTNYMFAIIILMIGIIFLVGNLRKPKRIHYHVTTLGIVANDKFYAYEEIKDFSLIYAPPYIKWLYVDFHRAWLPMLTIPLEDADPNEVRDAMLPYAFENIEREEETLTDMVRRLYKL